MKKTALLFMVFLTINCFSQFSNIADYFTQFFPLVPLSNLIAEPFSGLSGIKNIETQIGVDNIKRF